jgi:hypothetical protein
MTWYLRMLVSIVLRTCALPWAFTAQLLARASDAVLPRAPRVEPTPCEPHPVRSADDLQPVASTTLTDAQLSELAAQHNRSVVRIDRDRAVYGPARDSRVH